MVITANDLKESINKKKLAKGENEVNVQEWAAETDSAVEEAEKYKRPLAGKIEQIDRRV